MGLLNKKELTSSAKVVDKHLILSLPNAVEPVIWRMSLDKIGTASFEIASTKNSTVCKLVLKPKKGTAETIAKFNQKDESLEALIKASEALQSSEHADTTKSKIATENKAAPSNKEKTNHKWLYLFIGFLAVIGLYAYMSSLMPKKINDFGQTKQTNTAFGNAPKTETGVPLSADDFLNGM